MTTACAAGDGADGAAEDAGQVEQAAGPAEEGHGADRTDDPDPGVLAVEAGHGRVQGDVGGGEGLHGLGRRRVRGLVEGEQRDRTVPVCETGSLTRFWEPAVTRRTTNGAAPPTVTDSTEQPTRH